MKAAPLSCMICAKAKSKCVRLPDQEACDRCTRLQKVCITKERGTAKRKSNKITKQKQLQILEKKIESLAHVLVPKPRHEGEEVTIATPTQLTPVDTPPLQKTGINLEIQDQHRAPRLMLGSPETSSQHTLSETTVSFANLSPYEVQNLLDRYTTLMAPHAPFVSLLALPATASSFTSSLLLQAIVTVAHFHDTTIQKTLVKDLVQRITSRVFANAEKSLGLLQALLVLCTWYNPHIFTSTSHTSLLHLCMSLTTDLAIDRDPASCEMAHMAAAMKSFGIPQSVKTITDEERRAVLGVFWLASTVFTSFRKTDVPSWTPWLSGCCQMLLQTGLESDAVLVSLVRSQRVMYQAMSPHPLYDPEVLQTKLDNTVPPNTHTPDATTTTALDLQRTCALIAIWEPSFKTHNLSGIWSCISSLTSYLTLYTSLPISCYLSIPFTVFAQFAYVFVVMVRASSMHFDGFDGTLLRELIDFEKVMEEASEKYEAVSRLEVDGVRVWNGGFAQWAGKCRWAKTFYSMKARENEERSKQTFHGDVTNGAHARGDLPLDDSFLEENEWLGNKEYSLGFLLMDPVQL